MLKEEIVSLGMLTALVAIAGCSSLGVHREDSDSERLIASDPRSGHLILVGHVPTRYLPGASNPSTTNLAKIVIRGGVIQSVTPITESQISALKSETPILVLRSRQTDEYDVIYPGLIDLHNHTKQNALGLWEQAKGQFENRFEWRAWGNYKLSVSGNMNPWIGYGKPITCAAFRWSELQSMALGTTYLQGPSSCVTHFGIHRVEDPSAFAVERGTLPKLRIQAPTDIIYPREMSFVWNEVLPKMKEIAGTQDFEETLAKTTYEEGLKAVIHQYCPDLQGAITDVNGSEELKILRDQTKLKAACSGFSDLFIRYVYFIHPTVAGKKNYLQSKAAADTFADHSDDEDDDGSRDLAAVISPVQTTGPMIPSAVIAHLSEGRRNDPYNQMEFPLLRVLGLDLPGFNVVHGVGIDANGYRRMARQKMGLIWSPFSNLLLYGETADIKTAHQAGVTIALGSDWTPTGSKSVLEELKIARQYIRNHEDKELARIFDDEYLYRMVTENSATLMNHLETNPRDGYHGIGKIVPDAMGTLIAVAKTHANPYTNLMQATEKEINLVVVDGNPQYGNIGYVNTYNDQSNLGMGYEEISMYFDDLNHVPANAIPAPPIGTLSADQKMAQLIAVARSRAVQDAKPVEKCNFPEKKVLVHQSSGDRTILEFEQATGLNLDRYSDIQRLLAANLMTQSRNLHDPSKGDRNYAASYFPPLLSCADPQYQERLRNFMDGANENAANGRGRQALRRSQNLGRLPQTLVAPYRR